VEGTRVRVLYRLDLDDIRRLIFITVPVCRCVVVNRAVREVREKFKSEPVDEAGAQLTLTIVEIALLAEVSADRDPPLRFLSDFSLDSSRGIRLEEGECSGTWETKDCESDAISDIMTSPVFSSEFEFTRSNWSKTSNAKEGRRGRGRSRERLGQESGGSGSGSRSLTSEQEAGASCIATLLTD